jgi:SOS response associated peptidase (SRAP)
LTPCKGLIPYWAKDPKIAYRTINAGAETIDKAPSFREAFAERRCLIPADGFYEWRETTKPKLPFATAMKDGCHFTAFVRRTHLFERARFVALLGCYFCRFMQFSKTQAMSGTIDGHTRR